MSNDDIPVADATYVKTTGSLSLSAHNRITDHDNATVKEIVVGEDSAGKYATFVVFTNGSIFAITSDTLPEICSYSQKVPTAINTPAANRLPV